MFPQGLTHNEVRLLAENVHDQPEHHDDRAKRAEFSLPTWLVLNALEVMGFKVGLLHGHPAGSIPKKVRNHRINFTCGEAMQVYKSSFFSFFFFSNQLIMS